MLEAVKRNGHALEFAAEELRADREVVLEAVKQDRGAIVYAAEELRLATRVVQLVAESAGANVSVRCLNMGGEEMAVLQCAPELDVRKLVRKIKTTLPLGLGCIVLVLPDGSRLDVYDLHAEAQLCRCRIFWERFARGRGDAPMAVRREDRGGAPIRILLWAAVELPP